MLLYAYMVLPFTDFKLQSIFTLSSDCVVEHSVDCIFLMVICIALLSYRKFAHVFYIYRTRHEWRSLRTIVRHRSGCLPRLQPPLRRVSQQKKRRSNSSSGAQSRIEFSAISAIEPTHDHQPTSSHARTPSARAQEQASRRRLQAQATPHTKR